MLGISNQVFGGVLDSSNFYKIFPCDSGMNDKYFGSTKFSCPLKALIPVMVLYQIISKHLVIWR